MSICSDSCIEYFSSVCLLMWHGPWYQGRWPINIVMAMSHMYHKSLNKSPPWIEVCLKLTPGAYTQVCIIDASLKLKPGCGLIMYGARAHLQHPHVFAMACAEATTWSSNWRLMLLRCRERAGCCFYTATISFLRNRASSLGMRSTILPFFKTAITCLSNKLLFFHSQLVLTPCRLRSKVSNLSCRCGGPEMNASLDLTPVLNWHFLKNLGKEIDALVLFKGFMVHASLIGFGGIIFQNPPPLPFIVEWYRISFVCTNQQM